MNAPRIRFQPIHIALAAVAVVLVVVGVQMVNARTGARTGPPASASAAPNSPNSPNSPAGAADADTAATPGPAGQPTPGTPPADDDDGDGAADATATAAPAPADVTAARTAATAFTAAWLNTTNKTPDQWRADLAGHITPALANDLAAADPSTVPVGQIGSPITVTIGADRLAHVTIPITTGGAVTITVVLDGHPLVSDVDWTKP